MRYFIVSRELVRQICIRNGHGQCSNLLTRLQKLDSQSKRTASLLLSTANDINHCYQFSLVKKAVGCCVKLVGATASSGSTVGSICYITACRSLPSVKGTLILSIGLFGGLAFICAGSCIADTEMESYVNEKLNEVTPSIKSMNNSITAVKNASEEIGNKCADPEEISIADRDSITASTAQLSEVSQEVIPIVNQIWGALGRPAIQVITKTSIDIGSAAVGLVNSIASIIKNKQHPIAAQITNRIVPCLNEQSSHLDSVIEELDSHVNEN